MTSEIVNINRYAHGFLKKNIFSRRRINPLIIKWNSLSYNYDGCHKADKNQEAYDIAYELYILSQLDTFIKAPHPAIALAFLGEQAYKLKKVNLAHKHLEAAKVHIRKYLHIDPIFY